MKITDLINLHQNVSCCFYALLTLGLFAFPIDLISVHEPVRAPNRIEHAIRTFAHAYGDTALIKAVRIGDSEAVRLLLASSPLLLNKQNRYGSTPLFEAAGLGHTAIVNLLLAQPDIDVNIPHCHGSTALIASTMGGHEDIVEALLRHPDSALNHAGAQGNTALFMAIVHNKRAIAQRLMAHPAIDLNHTNQFGLTALALAALSPHAASILIALLSQPEIDVNKPDMYGKSPLMISVSNHTPDTIQALLNHPAIEINTRNHLNGYTALRYALENSRPAFYILMQHPGIEVNIADKKGNTPLMIAVKHRSLEGVNALLSNPHIDVNMVNKAHKSALHMTIPQPGEKNWPEYHTLRNTLLRSPHIYTLDTAFSYTIDERKYVIYDSPPLIFAYQLIRSHESYRNTVRHILANAPHTINEMDAERKTLLSYAIERKDHALAKQIICMPHLIEHRIHGSVLLTARHYNYMDLVEDLLLTDHISTLNAPNNQGNTLLLMLIQHSDSSISLIRTILAIPTIDVNRANAQEKTALMLAVQKNSIDIVRTLLAHPHIDISKKDYRGSTALDIARLLGHTSLVQLLESDADDSEDIMVKPAV